MRRGLIVAGVGLAALAAGGGLGLWRRQRQAAPDGAVELAFNQHYPDLNGKVQAMAQWRGQPVVLNFWATWCVPCVQEMPELSEMQTALRPRGLRVLGLAVDSTARVAAFAARLPVAYPLLITNATGIELSRTLGNEAGGLPFTVVIGRKGQIVGRISGRFDPAELTGYIEQALLS